VIEINQGDLFKSGCQALVNTVNCVGVMGAGIAFEFKHRFNDNYVFYREACARGDVKPGKMFITTTGIKSPEYIINFPTIPYRVPAPAGLARSTPLEKWLAAGVDRARPAGAGTRYGMVGDKFDRYPSAGLQEWWARLEECLALD
jgi:O-acetyl-ADP-ribose deacetylase (regulator of RNase III)